MLLARLYIHDQVIKVTDDWSVEDIKTLVEELEDTG